MNLTSEQVHWMFGAVLASAALLLMLRENERIAGRWLDFVTPSLLLLFGIELLVDPLIHGANIPNNYGTETSQHWLFAILLLAAGAAEIARLRRRGAGWPWRLPLAATLVAGAAIFAFHAQHDSSAPMLVLIAQHRVIAATLALLSIAFVAAPPLERPRGPSPFSFLLLLLGIELLLYTEGRSVFGEALTAHGMGAMR